jgi:hypothetical protein
MRPETRAALGDVHPALVSLSEQSEEEVELQTLGERGVKAAIILALAAASAVASLAISDSTDKPEQPTPYHLEGQSHGG